jgi:DNA polymerase-3 subunit delta'
MSWDRIRGHESARKRFQSALSHGRLGQSYFLVGPEGVGKQLFARELAQALLCEKPPSLLVACGHCPSCHQVEAGTHPDVLKVSTPEGKQELPIDEMRVFCAQLARTSVRGGRKIGIVLDADEFNEESANCFLKSLEEPPAGVILLLIATSTGRQLPTVLSRCQIVHFSPLTDEEISAVLIEQNIGDREKRDRLVKLAGGSVSRALALNDDTIWNAREELIAGVTSERPDFMQLAGMWLNLVEGAGKDSAAQRNRASVVIGFLIDVLRQALRFALGAQATGTTAVDERRIRVFAQRLGPDRLLELIDKCVEADSRVERRVQLILVIESVLEQFTRRASAV